SSPATSTSQFEQLVRLSRNRSEKHPGRIYAACFTNSRCTGLSLERNSRRSRQCSGERYVRNLIRALRQAGYDARRLLGGAALPKLGLRILGVFAEADERNRARRLLVGGEPVAPKMLLFVGVNSLTRPEQSLYDIAKPHAKAPRR